MQLGMLQISYLVSTGEATKEDKIDYEEYEKGLQLSNSKIWENIF